MINQERRQYSRKTLNPLPYINLPSDNGGIVLDVSEQGLRFRAAAPMEESGPIPFWFTAHSNLVAGIGELVWIDEAKRTGALRFTDLPYNALEQIRKWPNNSNLRPGISNDLTLHIPAPDLSPSLSANERGTHASLVSKVASQIESLLHGSFVSKVQEKWRTVLGNALAQLRALPLDAYFQKDRRWLFKAACALFLAIVIPASVYIQHRQAGELLIRLGTRLSGEVSTLTPAATVASQDPRTDNGSANKSNVDPPMAPVAKEVPQPVSAATAETVKEISTGAPAAQDQETPVQLLKPGTPRKELVLQVAALTQEVDARELTDRLRHENFQAFVGTLPVDSFYRVMLGPYTDEASARIVLGKLKKAGFNSFIRRDSVAERLGS